MKSDCIPHGLGVYFGVRGGRIARNDWITDHLDDINDVGVDDLLIVVAAWGPCQGECLADINNDGVVGTDDILAILAAWGPCI